MLLTCNFLTNGLLILSIALFFNMEHHKIAIIGGGIAGLAAAEMLSKHGQDYALYEARERLGGRIKTNRDGLTPYDMGASWAHDTLSNPLFDTVLDLIDKTGKDPFNLYYDDQEPLYFGKREGPKFFSRNKIAQVTKELEKFIELNYFEEIDKKDVTLREIITQYMEKQKRLLTKEQVLYAPQLARHLELWHGIGWDQMSSKFGLVDNVGRNCMFMNGYDELLKIIYSKLDTKRIFKEHIVTKIDRTKKPVKITFSNGHVVSADWVICTVPQSILQLQKDEVGGIEWFPQFPPRIKDSFSNMGWGKLGKVIFEFETPWWKHHDFDRFVALADPDSHFSKIWEAVEAKGPFPTFDGNDDTSVLPKPWDFPVLILNYYKTAKVPALLCFTQGPLTEYLERNPVEAWSYMRPILSRLLENDLDSDTKNKNLEDIPDPIKTIVSDWTVDPFSRGSYAACRPGDDPTDLVIQLEKGLGNVRFAGEHTILDGAGAVHGAWMSGQRESNYILIKENVIEGELDEW